MKSLNSKLLSHIGCAKEKRSKKRRKKKYGWSWNNKMAISLRTMKVNLMKDQNGYVTLQDAKPKEIQQSERRTRSKSPQQINLALMSSVVHSYDHVSFNEANQKQE
jgi:hypothetical protein